MSNASPADSILLRQLATSAENGVRLDAVVADRLRALALAIEAFAVGDLTVLKWASGAVEAADPHFTGKSLRDISDKIAQLRILSPEDWSKHNAENSPT